MGDLLLLLAGVALGARFAEEIREKVPVLAPPADAAGEPDAM